VVAAVVIAGSGSDDSAEGGAASPSGGTVVPAGDLDVGQVSVTGTALPAPPKGGGTDSAIGDVVPTIEGESFDGTPVTISAAGGKGQVVIGLAHWCPHCRAEVPRLQQWLDEDGMPDDVNLVAVATGNDPTQVNFPASQWLLREGWSVPTMVDDESNTAAQAIGLGSYPYFLVLDSEGKVITRGSGEIDHDVWTALLDAARTGQLPGA
jgi:thiol-disulfide isomerase/thioredoxin